MPFTIGKSFLLDCHINYRLYNTIGLGVLQIFIYNIIVGEMKLKHPASTYLAIVAITLLALGLIKIFNISYPLEITNKTTSGELSVVGEGKVDVVPDLATVQVGIVVANAATVDEAQNKINETNNKIVEAVEKLGVKKNDIKTSNYSINPNYSYENNINRINGYNGNANLNIKVRKLDNLPRVISEATKAGANQVYDTQYTVENPANYRELARQKAIENARLQAQKIASSLGIRLGKIVNVVESTPNQPPVPYLMKAEGMGGGQAPDLQPGSQTITSTVNLYFEKR